MQLIPSQTERNNVVDRFRLQDSGQNRGPALKRGTLLGRSGMVVIVPGSDAAWCVA